jgi:proline iminopeptidase
MMNNLWYKIEGEGRPIFLIHGGPGLDHSYFIPYLSPLADVFSLVYIDLPGQGRSPEPESFGGYTIQEAAKSIKALSSSLGFKKVSLLGHSYGGFVSLRFAIDYPENLTSLILVSAVSSNRYRYRSLEMFYRKATDEMLRESDILAEKDGFDEEDIERSFRIFLPHLFHKPPSPSELDAIISRIRFSATANRFFNLFELPSLDMEKEIPGITVPTLIISGRNDNSIPWEEGKNLYRLMPNAHFVIFEKSAHFPFIEENERFISEVRSFFRLQEQG